MNDSSIHTYIHTYIHTLIKNTRSTSGNGQQLGVREVIVLVGQEHERFVVIQDFGQGSIL